ncbi:unnamed protein product [Boreogadus saida]
MGVGPARWMKTADEEVPDQQNQNSGLVLVVDNAEYKKYGSRKTVAARMLAVVNHVDKVRWGSALTPRGGPEEEGWMSGPQKVVLVTMGDRVGRGGPTRMASLLELLSSRSEGAEWSRTEGLRMRLEMEEGLEGQGRRGGGGGGWGKKNPRLAVNGSKPKALERDVTEMDPALRLMLQEKERAVMTLQETVEVY